MALIIKQSKIHGRGCFTTTSISKGARVVEYTGRRISRREADERYGARPATYLFGLSDGRTAIDGLGVASLVNHCCEPNCAAFEEDNRVWFYALRDIAAGEELTIDYKLSNLGDRQAACHCGASKCRGTMRGPEREAEAQRHSSPPGRGSRRAPGSRRLGRQT